MATAAKLTEHYLTCIICSEVYTDPATLQCDHTFCRSCLLKYTKTQPEAIQAKSIPCPTCMQMTRVISPDRPVNEWVSHVKPSCIIQGLLDDFGSELDQIDMQICRVCKEEGETTQATAWCSVCNDILCDKCIVLHQRLPSSSHHNIEWLQEKVEKRTSGRFMCKIHEDEPVKLFCKDCKKAICHTCCSISHRSCKCVISTEEGLPEVKSFLLKKKQAFSKQATLYINNISTRKSQQEDIQKATAKIESDIRRNTERAVDLIHAKEKKLMEELEETRSKHIVKLKRETEKDEMGRKMYLQKTLLIDHAINSESQQDIYEACETIKSWGEAGRVMDDTTDLSTLVLPQITCNSDIEQMSEAIGNIELGRIHTAKIEGSIKIKTIVETIDTMTDKDSDIPSIIDVAILEVAGIKITVVVDKTNNNIKSFYTEDNQSRNSVLVLDGKPFGMAAIGANMIVVTSPSLKGVTVASVYPVLELVLTIPVGKGCHGIAKLDDLTMVVCKNGMVTSSVDIVDMKGNLLKSLSKNVVKYPYTPCLTSRGSILVSDRGLKSLAFISPEFTLSHSYRPLGDQALIQPRGVTTTGSGDILLVDKDANKVIQLTETGMLVRDILTSADGLDKPYGICMDNEGLVYVSCGRFVKVYKCFK